MVRAATAAETDAHPRSELVRLTELGLLHRLATVFYVAVPDDQVGTGWVPDLEPRRPVSRFLPTAAMTPP